MPSSIPSPRTVQTPLIGAVSQLVVGTNPTRMALVVFNPTQLSIFAISPPDITPSLFGTGSITLLPGQGIELDNWTNGLNAVSQLAGQAITIYEFYP